MNTKSFLAAMAGGTFSIFTIQAADPLEQWGQRTAPGTGYGLNAVAFGNGVFVAVGGNGTTLVSSDGANWTNSSPGNYGEWRNVRFLNGQFTVVGITNQMLQSSNGINWTTTTLPLGNYWDIAFGNGRYVVAGTTNFVSTDGVTWIPAGPVVQIGPPGVNGRIAFDTLTFGNGEFVAMPNSSFAAAFGIFYSADGTNWIRTSGPHSEQANRSDMIYENGLFVLAWNPTSTPLASLGTFTHRPMETRGRADRAIKLTAGSPPPLSRSE